MTRCHKGKRRLILASIALSGVFAGGALSGSQVFAEEVTSEAEGTVSSGTEDAGDVTHGDDAENSDAEKSGAVNFDADKSVADNFDANHSEEESSDAEKTDAESFDAVKSDAENFDAGKPDEKESDTKDAGPEEAEGSGASSSDGAFVDATEVTAEEEGISSRPELAPEGETQNGWATEGDYTYYYIDGEKVKNTIMQIDGAFYGFYSDGRLRKNSSFSMYDQTDRVYYYYHAGSDGRLFCGEWYETTVYSGYGSESRKYYFDDLCRGARGIYMVDGKNYLFDSSGLLMIGRCTNINGVPYAGTNDGYPKKLKDSGWNQAGGSWFYLENGKATFSQIKEIDGDLYSFDSYGTMLNNNETYSTGYYDAEEEYRYGSCRAKKGGKLYRNEWFYEEKTEEWYYYGSDGFGLSGYHKVGKKCYFFSDNGMMVTDDVRTGEEGDLTYTYVIDKEGSATRLKQNGWSKVGNDYYYTTNGKPYTDEVAEIDGKKYGFSYSGKMYDDCEFSISQSEEGKWVYYYYRAKAGGELYRLSWFHREDYDEWYYYGSDGRAVTGVRTISKKTYCFDRYGEMYRNTTCEIDGKLYLCLDSGVAKEMPANRWTKFNGKWYYCNSAGLVKNSVTNIDGKNYGFDSDGVLITDKRYSMNGRYYRADKDGVVLTDQWYGYEYYGGSGYTLDGYHEVNGKAYYFIRGTAQKNVYCSTGETLYRAGTNGVLKKVTADGVYYGGLYRDSVYLVEGGELVTDQGWRKIGGEWYYTSQYGTPVRQAIKNIDDKFYYFHEDGTMAKGGWIRTSRSSYSDNTMYAKASGELLTGEQTIDGKKYYFGSTGIMATGITEVNGERRLYGTDGAFIGIAKEDGWNEIDGSWYYLLDGELLTGGQTIGKYDYLFNSFGVMLSDYLDSSRKWIYDRKGRRVTGGWVQSRDGQWYYVDPETGKYLNSGEYTIGNKTYYFDYYGAMATEDQVFYQEGKGYLRKIAKDGSVTVTEFSSDWEIVDGRYCYKENKTGWVGDYYISYGECFGPTVTEDGYLTDLAGKKVTKTGWFTISVSFEDFKETFFWYVKKDQKAACSEWVKDNGTWYYFDSEGMLRMNSFMDGNTLYLIDDQGKMIRQVDHAEDGWYAVGKNWVFVQGGEIISDGFFQENDDRYYKLYSGEIAKDSVNGYNVGFAFGSDGKADVKSTGWKNIGGRWYYTRKNGTMYFGWNDVGGKLYYITSAGMSTGYSLIDGVMYQFDKNGALIGKATYQEGWQKLGGSWYYAENGNYFKNGKALINGKEYIFDSDGKMLVGKEAMIEGYYTDSNGVMLKNTWKKIDGDWYYFTGTGRLALGYQKIGGKTYYFGIDGRMKE